VVVAVVRKSKAREIRNALAAEETRGTRVLDFVV
jgi:hypothetical protein